MNNDHSMNGHRMVVKVNVLRMWHLCQMICVEADGL
jgi:hypothetical protein